MPYTDAQGRPEIVADELLKRGATAGWHVVSAGDPAGHDAAADKEDTADAPVPGSAAAHA